MERYRGSFAAFLMGTPEGKLYQCNQRRAYNDRTGKKSKAKMILADTITGEINRMCVTDELSELDTMTLHARKNIEKLHNMRYEELKKKKCVTKQYSVID